MESNYITCGALLSFLAVVLFSGKFTEAAILKSQNDFGGDGGFGNGFGPGPAPDSNKQSKNKAYCTRLCQFNEDCCPGDICGRNFLFGKGPKYGYCVKHCPPVGPGEDCRRCQGCTKGYVCTIFLNAAYHQEYRCIRKK